MKEETSRKLVTWLLIASPLWWTTGCYSMREIERPIDAGNQDIEVSTKSNESITFHQWTVDSLGTIRGRIYNPAFRSHIDPQSGIEITNGEPRYTVGERSMPKDSIASIRTEGISVPLSILAGGGVLALAFILCPIVFLLNVLKKT